MEKSLSGRVAMVTGAGKGLGRAHAELLAREGAKLIVNDLDQAACEEVVEAIRRAGGEAVAAPASVTDFDAIVALVDQAHAAWGSIDILVNNAGILRDRTFSKMDLDDFRLILDVHVMGSVNCTKAVWRHMQNANYGRIVMTTSSSGLFGNFGQSNYGAAKMAVVGLMQTLAIEGAKHNIRVNCLAPTASTDMLAGLLPPEHVSALRPELVSPGVLALALDNAPTRTILCAGAGAFEQAHITLTRGIMTSDPDTAAETIAASWERIGAHEDQVVPNSASEQGALEIHKASASS